MHSLSFLFFGIDSLVAATALSPLVTSSRRRYYLAAMFGLADAAGFVVGWALHVQLSEQLTGILGSAVICGYGLYVLFAVAGTQRSLARWPVWIVPWALCLDNLGAGLTTRSSSASMLGQATLQGISSTLMGLLGLAVGLAARRVLAGRASARTTGRIAGGGLIVGAAVLLFV